jgi:hypothetical protein
VISISEWYHTGDEEWDDFVDENIDIFITFLKVYGVLKFREMFHKAVGVSLAWTTIGFIAAKWGANIAGFYLSGLIDGSEGLRRWNDYQQRAYDWGPLDDYVEIGDLSIGDILPNPFAIADVFVESLEMISDYQLKRDKLALGIVEQHLETQIEHVYYDIWKPLISPQYDTTFGV